MFFGKGYRVSTSVELSDLFKIAVKSDSANSFAFLLKTYRNSLQKSLIDELSYLIVRDGARGCLAEMFQLDLLSVDQGNHMFERAVLAGDLNIAYDLISRTRFQITSLSPKVTLSMIRDSTPNNRRVFFMLYNLRINLGSANDEVMKYCIEKGDIETVAIGIRRCPVVETEMYYQYAKQFKNKKMMRIIEESLPPVPSFWDKWQL